nr:MAG TPA: AAA domain protein [Crassvirales sp.]
MARILVLAKSGFGKTFSIGQIPELGHKGLDPKETYVVSVTSKPLTFPKSRELYKVTPCDKMAEGNRVITNDPEKIASILEMLLKSPYKNIVVDDFNYLMQDYYMANALKGGWDTPKKIGFFMGKIFDAIEKYGDTDKNIIVLAHGEEMPQPDGRIYLKMKTTGKMVDEYVTPEGKFDITLVGRTKLESKKIVKEFITNEDEYTASPKSPYGMFESLYIPNDLGLVVDAVKNYYG